MNRNYIKFRLESRLTQSSAGPACESTGRFSIKAWLKRRWPWIADMIRKMKKLVLMPRRLQNSLDQLSRVEAAVIAANQKLDAVFSFCENIQSLQVSLDDVVRVEAAVIAANQKLDNQLQDAPQRHSQLMEAMTQLAPKPNFYDQENNMVIKFEEFFLKLPREDVKLTACLLFDTLEPGLRGFLRRQLRPGMVFVDVGAHVGLITLLAGRLVGKAGKVFAFEPTPRTFGLLRDNIVLNDLEEIVVTRDVAVSDSTGSARLHLFPVYGHNSLVRSAGATSEVEIPTDTLDRLLSGGLSFDFVKIDAEGAEWDILLGMNRVLTENPGVRIILEFGPSHLIHAGKEPRSFLKYLREIGFRISAINEPDGSVSQPSDDELLEAFSTNLLLEK